MSAEDRRHFIFRVFRLAGLFASYGAWNTWVRLTRGGKGLGNISSVTQRLLVSEPTDLIDAFAEARGAPLIYYCQMFFPTFITGNEIEKVALLEQLCEKRIKTAGQVERARLRVIPAMAAAHMLPIADGEESQILRDVILNTNLYAIEGDPCRMVLGLMWTSMTAALIRNRSNWGIFLVGQDIINAAVNICRDFIAGGDATLLLMHSALAAWQFLLTYQRSLVLRKNAGYMDELRMVLSGISKIGATKGERCVWFDEFAKLYENRLTYESMLPEYLESVVARSGTLMGSPDREASDLFVLVRLQIIYSYFLIGCGKLRSLYFGESKLADDFANRAFALLINSRVTPADWKTLRVRGEHFLTRECIHHFDSVFENYDNVAVQCGVTETTINEMDWFTRHAPFKEALAEESVAEKVYKRRDLMGSALEALSGGVSDVFSRLAFCLPALVYGCKLEIGSGIARTQDNDIIKEVQNASLEVLRNKKYKTAFKLLSEDQPSFRETLAKNQTTIPVGRTPAGGGKALLRRKENVNETNQQNDGGEAIVKPAELAAERARLAGWREDDPALEQSIREDFLAKAQALGFSRQDALAFCEAGQVGEDGATLPGWTKDDPALEQSIREGFLEKAQALGFSRQDALAFCSTVEHRGD
jgi:hypothetical protein